MRRLLSEEELKAYILRRNPASQSYTVDLVADDDEEGEEGEEMDTLDVSQRGR